MSERVAIYQHSLSNGIWLKTEFQARITYIDGTKDKMYKVGLGFSPIRYNVKRKELS